MGGKKSFGSHSLTYGEVDFFSFNTILELVKPQDGQVAALINQSIDRSMIVCVCIQVFVDLGHGTGKAVVSAALLYGHVLSECRGIELLKPLHDVSERAVDRYHLVSRGRAWLYGPHGASLSFV